MAGKLVLLSVILAISSVLPLSAKEVPGVQGPIGTALSRPTFDRRLPLEEVQRYCESHIRSMPEITSLEAWERYANRLREETLQQVFYRGKTAKWRDAACKVEWLETIEGGPGYRIRKLRFEAVPGLWVPALLYEPENLVGKVPVVLNVNGHEREIGKASQQKQTRCINQAKRGMIALNPEWFGMGQLESEGFGHYRINQIDLCGTSGVGPHFLAMQRGLDILLDHQNADPKRVAVTGISGGGWQTITISALDTRVTLTNPVAGYSGFRERLYHYTDNFTDLGDSEQTSVDLGRMADYLHLTALLAPRPALLTYNAKDDCCFRAGHALPPLLEAAMPVYKLYGKENHLRTHINEDPGTHNYGQDNRQQLYQMLGDHFFPNDKNYNAEEIAVAGELKSKEELTVPLPETNADFHSIALELASTLPREPTLPAAGAATDAWQKNGRKTLSEILRSEKYDVQAHSEKPNDLEQTTANPWRFRIGNAWTVPAVVLQPEGEVKSTVLLIADEGRKSVASQAETLLAAGHRVFAVDPFYFGESAIPEEDFLFGLVVSAIGKRPLGIQVSQLTALATWASKHFQSPVELRAVGPRTSLIALATAALQPTLITRTHLEKSYGSLKEILEKDLDIRDGPELFCFGLLEQFDLLQLAALATPSSVQFIEPSPRVLSEFAPLRDWYSTQNISTP